MRLRPEQTHHMWAQQRGRGRLRGGWESQFLIHHPPSSMGFSRVPPPPASLPHARESLSATPPAPCCGCREPPGAVIGLGRRLRAAQEAPGPPGSSEPAQPAKEARPAGRPRLPCLAGFLPPLGFLPPSLPPASLPGRVPSQKAKGPASAATRVLLTWGWKGMRCPWGASHGTFFGHPGESHYTPSDKEPGTKLLCARTC